MISVFDFCGGLLYHYLRWFYLFLGICQRFWNGIMRSELKMRDFLTKIKRINIQNCVVALCVMAVCIGTQQIQTAAWNSGRIEFFRDSMCVLLAIIMMTHYKWKDFLEYRVIYVIWSVLGISLCAILVPIAVAKRFDYLKADTIVIALGIFLMGYCLIHTVISLFIKKERQKLYKPLFVIWTVMMLLMIFSRSDYLWPECYFVIFLCFYLTDRTPVQRTNVAKGLINGMILGFVSIQAHALLCRPYDRARYIGNFCNPNNNSLFLCMCLAAILAKILFLTKEDRKFIVKAFYFLLAGACYSFICMTASRSGYLAAFVLTIFFLSAYCKIREKRVFIRAGLLLVTIFLVMFPLTYLAVRYIPTIHPHVNFYYQEGYSEDWVHSWDARDSEKFISFEELLQSIFGRFAITGDANKGMISGVADRRAQGNLIIVSERYIPHSVLLDAAEAAKTPLLQNEDAENAFKIRYTIYKWYMEHLSMRGMPYEEQGFQLLENYWIQHAHNIYLDYGINFGIPVMVLFAVFIWWGIGRLVRQGLRQKDVEKLACLLIVLVPPVFGLFEFSWGAGMVSTVVFYMAFVEICRDDQQGDRDPNGTF